MSEAVIEFSLLTKVYSFGFWGRKQRALDGLSLRVERGAIYGFLGANGAGKTTGIKILMGLQFPTTGSVKIFGLSPEDPRAKARIGYMPERPYFHDSMVAADFLHFHRSLFGSYLGKKLPSNEELLELVGLAQVADKPLKGFSKGMLQRIGIAQALVNDPELVVLDEPMSGLDPVGRKEMRDLILRLGQRGKTVFFSSHILSDVESICHRIAFLEKGVLKFEGDIAEIRKSGSHRQEILFTGLRQEQVAGDPSLSAAIRTGDAYLLHTSQVSHAKAAIETVWKLGGTLLAYHPEQRSLEDFLFGKEKA